MPAKGAYRTSLYKTFGVRYSKYCVCENVRYLVIIAHCGEPAMAKSHYDNAQIFLHLKNNTLFLFTNEQKFIFVYKNNCLNTNKNYNYE